MEHHYLTAIVGIVSLAKCTCGECPPPSPPSAVVCSDCLDNTGAHLEFPEPPVDDQYHGAVLFSGYRNGWCRRDNLCIGNPDVYLGDVKWHPHPGDACPKYEVVAFARGRAPTVLGSSAPIEFPSPDSNWFAAPESVKVTLWEIDSAAWANQEAQVETAKAVFENVGSGITLDLTVSPREVPVSRNNQEDYECGQSSAAAVRRLSGYDPKSVNVYYVASIFGNRHGLTCPNPNDSRGVRDIIFIQNGAQSHALAHELGHALGLNRTATFGETEMRTGDIDELDMGRAFGDNNLMNYNNQAPSSLTIGQIYRMHFDVRSWLNKGKAEVPDGYPRECQDNPVAEGKCPPLALSPPQGWP